MDYSRKYYYAVGSLGWSDFNLPLGGEGEVGAFDWRDNGLLALRANSNCLAQFWGRIPKRCTLVV